MRVRQAGKGKRGAAFSIPEILVCLLLWGALAGAVMATCLPSWTEGKGTQAALREAEQLTRWIQRSLIKACIERRAFEIKYYTGRNDFLKIQWFNPSEQETYTTRGRCWVQFDTKTRVKPRYTPAWHTMTPAVTLKVYADNDKYSTRGPVARITISGYCLVSLRGAP